MTRKACRPLSGGGLSPAPGLGRFAAAGAEAFEEFGRGFVGRVLGHKFTAEGLREQRRVQLPDLPAGRCVAGFDTVGEGEQGFDAADDFILFT